MGENTKWALVSFSMVALALAISGCGGGGGSKPKGSPKPHIVMVLADDLGWANVGWHSESSGNHEARTPVMDDLVKNGVELDRHYAYKYCSPSRCALQTGRNPIHVNVLNKDPSVWNPLDNVSGFAGIPRNMTGMGQVMKNGGYRTHFVGKWDVGMATKEHTPKGRGYDTSLGYFYHLNDYWNYTVDDDAGAGPKSCATSLENNAIVDLWMSNETYEGPAESLINNIEKCSPEGENPQPADESECVYEDFLFSRHVQSLVKDHGINHADEPFFLCYAPHIAHEPLQVPKAFENNFSNIDNERRRLYAAMVYLLDKQIGELVDQLKQVSMWDNTLFVFASDNGGPIYRYGVAGANNNPLRGGKASNFEGGIRVPAFVSGGFLPESARGTTKAGLSALWDWYGTFAAMGGIDPYDAKAALAQLPEVDSVNLWPYISGETDEPPRKELELGVPSGWRVVWTGLGTSVNGLIVDEGDDGLWKLLINEIPMAVWQGPSFPNTTEPKDWDHSPGEKRFAHCGNGCLFNLLTDPSEHVDLAAEYPDRLQAMKEKAGTYNGTVFDVDRGPFNRKCCTTAQTTHKNFWGPFLDIPATVSTPAVLTVV